MSDEMKTCKKCGIEKPLTLEFYAKSDGGKYFYHKCRDCMNEEKRIRRAKSKGIDYNPAAYNPSTNYKNSEVKPNVNNNLNYKTERNSYLMLSQDEIKIVKNMIEDYPALKNILNSKINLELDENKKRTVRTINLDDKIYSFIKEQSKKTNLSISDIVNKMLLNSMKYMD